MNEIFAGIATVVLDVAINKSLDYGITTEKISLIHIGSRVEVPMRGAMKKGYVIDLKDKSPFPNIKPIGNILSDSPLITRDLFQLALWIARYYCSPLRDVFRLLLPPSIRKGMKHKEQLFVMRGKTREELIEMCITLRATKPAQALILDAMLKVKKGIFLSKLLEETKGSRGVVDTLAKKGLLILENVKIDRSPLINEEYFMSGPKTLNECQSLALKKIQSSLNDTLFQTHLLYGITGSGKTEIYLQSIDSALKQGKGAIMMVPEISLTAQTIERFRCRFKERIAILHHRLSDGERHDEWQQIRSGNAKIVIGARSAIFSPVVDLGLIIVDEEHEQSYKQNELSPCYQARDVAVMRGKLTNSTVILGSATPSLESYYNAASGKYILSVLNQRAETAALPQVTVVDMKGEFEKAKGWTNFSEKLLSGIEKRIDQGEQTILFLNRRGYHTVLLCQECGQSIKCSHCDLPMTFHLNENCLTCHLCSFNYSPPPKECPSCRGKSPLKFRGVGTEQIERALHAIFPKVRTLRIDADTTKHKGSHQKILREFGSGKADVLIGTQMIAKGLHFPEVTLVGVLNSDAGLMIPDFRVSENVFQLITQVAGRSGRGVIPGEVIIQTTMPGNATIRHAAQQDYIAFFQEEIEVRKHFRYPPFCRMAKILLSGDHQTITENIAANLRSKLVETLPSDFELHPVSPSGYKKIKDRFRYQFLIRGPTMYSLNQAIRDIQHSISWPKDIKIFIDIDPSSTFF